MKKSFRASILFVICFTASGMAGEWSSDYGKSMELAKMERKIVLVDFTGSTWCGPCIKLDKEVFSDPAFKEYANKNLVLVKVDFPPSFAQSKKNDLELAEKLGVPKNGIMVFPTLVVMGADGKKLGDFFYEGGGPSDFIAQVEKLRPK